MRISFLELEDLRSDPKAWAIRKNDAGFSPRMGYRGLTKLALYKFHKTNNLSEARLHLTKLLDNRKLKDTDRRSVAEMQLKAYADWFLKSAPIVVDVRARSRLDLSHGWFISGEVSRIDLDLDSDGYRAITIAEVGSDWRTRLQMPLLQAAIASRYQRDRSLISVGVQALDGSGMDVHSYSSKAIQQSVAEANAIISIARKHLRAN